MRAHARSCRDRIASYRSGSAHACARIRKQRPSHQYLLTDADSGRGARPTAGSTRTHARVVRAAPAMRKERTDGSASRACRAGDGWGDPDVLRRETRGGFAPVRHPPRQ
eukprot:259247-Pleurochrysis_carterae.AAC.1